MNDKFGIGFAPSGKELQKDPQYDISSLDPKLSRTNYFDGRLLKASDLTRDQAYLDERLREVGRVIGSGVVQGFDVLRDPSNDNLQVWPGLAVAPSGRVLELGGEDPLVINPYDAANIASLNPDGPNRLERGLYALAVQFAEIGTDSAEVYPRDLEGERGFHFNAWSEGVEITLVPLRQRPPNSAASEADRVHGGHALSARSALVREFISNPGQPIDLPEDAVAIALVAIEHGRLLWIDKGLVRRPHRHPHTPNVLQQDLHRHYQELLNDIIQSRRERHLTGEYPASHYFRVLPPYGELPKVTITPAVGRQTWFPSGCEVSIAPVRSDDLGAILAESAALDPIDLEKDDDVDIMILVPMSDYQFAWRARQLQHRVEGDSGEGHTELPHLDSLALRLYDVTDTKIDPDDASVWNSIWAEAERPLFVRRPPRVAETLVSGVVLASGYEIPDGTKALPPSPEKLENERDYYEHHWHLSERTVDRLELDIKELEAKLAQGTDERLKAAEKSVFELKEQLEAALRDKDELELLRKQYDLQKVEIEKLLDRIAALEGEGDGNETLLKRIEELRADLADADAQIEVLKKQLESVGGGIGLPTIMQLVVLRGGDATMQKAGAALAEIIRDDDQRLLAVHQIAQLIDRRYDALLMETLVEVAKTGNLSKLRDFLMEVLPDTSVGEAMAEAISGLGIAASLANKWIELEKTFGGAGSGDEKLEAELKAALLRIAELEKALEAGTSEDTVVLLKENANLRAALAAANARIEELEKAPGGTDGGNETELLEKTNADLLKQLEAEKARSAELEKAASASGASADVAALKKEVADLRLELDASKETSFSVDFRTVKVRPLEELWEERLANIKAHPDIDEIQVNAEKVFSLTKSNKVRQARACQILAITPQEYDAATWRTLPSVLTREDGTPFRDFMVKVRQAGVNIGLAVASNNNLGLTNTIKAHWAEIDMPK